MAVVRPFRAVRYAHPEGADISHLTAPPYDVVSSDQRERLLSDDPHNVVALELPEGPLDADAVGNRYQVGGDRWREWLANGVLAQDDAPALYVLEQTYAHDGVRVSRRGFVAAVGLEPFSAGVILPHERTLPKAIDDRLRLTRSTGANLSQVFGMFADPEHTTDVLIEKAMRCEPLALATDDAGVTSTVWALRDPDDHAAFADRLARERIFIADGHHRYTTALAYRDECRAAAGGSTARGAADPSVTPEYDRVMMALVNMVDPGLTVWPTHRIVDAPDALDLDGFWTALSEHFAVSEWTDGSSLQDRGSANGPVGFLVRTRDGRTRVATLRADVDHSSAFPEQSSLAWRSLDVAVLQELVLSPLLGVHPDRPETLDRLRFSKDADEALSLASQHDVAFVLRPTRMDQIAAVALAGETMPQKSTYFYPKLLSGLLFKRLDD